MSNDMITIRLPQKHAAFLQANLAVLATTTRQAMTRPGLDAERRTALGSRASLLETIEDAVRSAMLEMPQNTRRSARGVEMVARKAA
jgi:hypothetical protein